MLSRNVWVGVVFITLNLLLYPTFLDVGGEIPIKLFKIDKKAEEKVKECVRNRLVVKYSGR